MRTVSSDSKSRLQRKGKSIANLSQLKKSLVKMPFLSGQNASQRSGNCKQGQQGHLHLGKISRPTLILTREERLDPWANRNIISEQLLNKKGILQLTNLGVLSKNVNFSDLLNNRYEIVTQKIQNQHTDAFLTSPAILIDTYLQASRKEEVEEQKKKVLLLKEKAVKIRSAKKKVIKKEEKPIFQVIQEKVMLNMLGYKIQKNQAYQQYLKKTKRIGMQHVFRIFVTKMEHFTTKYHLKKITFSPQLNETRHITQRQLLQSIVNHRIFGIDLKVKGSPMQLFCLLVRSKVEKMRYKLKRQAILKIQNFKNRFKIKKFYQEMVEKRWKFVNFKLGSFTQNQRRLISDNASRAFKPQVEIHLLTSDTTPTQQVTYYKWKQRKKIQLTRLFNNEASHLILILNKQEDISLWLEQVLEMKSSWKRPAITLFFSSLKNYEVGESADVYFGLKPKQILEIRKICFEKNAVLVPYVMSQFLPKICEILGVNLFAGTFTEESKTILFEQDQIKGLQNEKKPAQKTKFKRLKKTSIQVNCLNLKKYKHITLANQLFESKHQVKLLFQALNIQTPISVSIANVNERDFYQELTKVIISQKQYGSWVLKLPDSTFSRGLAFLETDSLKIIKESKKRQPMREEDVEQIASIMESILIQKIRIPHNSLIIGQEYLTAFKKKGGYVESQLDNCVSIGVFGRIEINGNFTFLGSYRKYYAQNVCFGAIYPASQVTEELIQKIHSICSELYILNVFGYITFELLFDVKAKLFWFIDIVPHLENFSSLYFYYKRLLDINEIDPISQKNKLKRCIFYCPFLDNNGNKCTSLDEFNRLIKAKKLNFDSKSIEGVNFLFLNETLPQALSMVCVGIDQSSVLRLCLQGLRFLVESGGQFNKFDKKFKGNQSDGLYIMDILWKIRQLKKQKGEK